MTAAGRLTAVAGGLVAAAVAACAALVEILWLPLRVDGLPVPVSVPAAAVANLLMVSLTHRLTRSRAAALVPAVVWLVVVLPASQRRAEGDVLLIGDWRGLAFLLFGVLGASLAVGRLLGTPPAPGTAPEPAQESGARR